MSIPIGSAELERSLREFRKRLGLEEVAFLDPMTVITKLKVIFKGFDYLRVPNEEMPNEEAQWDSYRNLILVRESTFSGMQSNNGRARFAIFHEVLHFLYGHQGIRNRSTAQTIAERVNFQVKKEEREANRAAPILMAPAYLILPKEPAESIAFRFGLSRAAAKIRREDLDSEERRRSGLSRPLPEAARAYLRDAERRGYKVTARLDDDGGEGA